jgi:hypothetical protein
VAKQQQAQQQEQHTLDGFPVGKTLIYAWTFDAELDNDTQRNKLEDFKIGTTGRFGGVGEIRENEINKRLYAFLNIPCLLKTDTILNAMGDLRQWVLIYRPPSAQRLNAGDMERFLDVQMRNTREQVRAL